MQPPGWVQWLASLATILSFPITVLSLNATFSVTPVEVTLPDMPFGLAIEIIAFLLLSVVFAVAFASWYRFFDNTLRVDRLVLVPILALLSAAQTFALVEILFGGFATEASPGVFGAGLGAALAIEIRHILRGHHRNEVVLILAHALVYAGFSTVIAAEADPSTGSDVGNVLMFLFALVIVGGISSMIVGFAEQETRERAVGEGR